MRLIYAERAISDIAGIYDMITVDSVASAQRVEDAIRARCEELADFPLASSTTDEPDIRRRAVTRYPYTIFFRFRARIAAVEIARVIPGIQVRDLEHMPD